MRGPELTWYRLRFPRELDEAAATAALSAVAGMSHRTRLILDLSASAEHIEHRLAVTPDAADLLLGSLRAAMPSARVDEIETPTPGHGQRVIWQLAPSLAALQTGSPTATSAALLASLFPLQAGESIRLSWHLRSGPRPPLRVTAEHRREGEGAALRMKLAGPGLQVYGLLAVQARGRPRTAQLWQRVASVLRGLNTPHGQLAHDSYWYGRALHLLGLRGRYWSVAELAAVIGWPLGGVELPNVETGASRRLVPSRSLPRQGRVLGISDFAGVTRPVALSPTASTRGLYILGPTGTGKTSLIKNLVVDDLRAGRGLAVVETNGDLITDLLDLIPKERVNDVILLDPTDRMAAVGFNPFVGSDDPSLVADQLGELFQRLWKQFWGPRTGQLAHMALLSLAGRPGSTLLDLPRLFLDPSFRRTVVSGLDDPLGLEIDWRWYEHLAAKEQAVVIAPLLNKVRQFTARRNIRAIVGQARPAITMRDVLAEDKVLLVNLPKGLIGAETAQLLGCLVLTGLWQAATERARLRPSERRPFGLYVDEVQDFAAAPIPWDELFAQGRKYGLSLSVAHQNLDQLDRPLREVILANARSKAVFALSASDARVMAHLFAPALTDSDLQALDAFSVAALVALDDGSTAPPVTLQTPPPPEPLGSAQAVRAASAQRYARPRADVEAELRSRAAPRPSAPVGRKRRTT